MKPAIGNRARSALLITMIAVNAATACGSRTAAPGNATTTTTQMTPVVPPTQLTGIPEATQSAAEENLTPKCAAGQADLTAAAAPGSYRACAKPGTTVTIRIAPPAEGTWAPLQTSASAQIQITDQQSGLDRALAAHLRTGQPGTATITTRSRPGDPHGPPSYNWTLSVTVIP